MDFNNYYLLIGLAIIAVLSIGYFYYSSPKPKQNGQKEEFTYDQIALNAKNYTFIPTKDCQGCLPQARPDFASMTCNTNQVPDVLKGMTQQQIKDEIDLHYRKPMEMLEVKDLLPESELSGLSFGTDPAEDFANKFVWHRTTHARLKRRNWETGAAMIRGDLIIDPGKQSWFQHDNDYRDLTPGFIPKSYCGEIDVEDLTYNMHKIH
jgi:hypothetical protein